MLTTTSHWKTNSNYSHLNSIKQQLIQQQLLEEEKNATTPHFKTFRKCCKTCSLWIFYHLVLMREHFVYKSFTNFYESFTTLANFGMHTPNTSNHHQHHMQHIHSELASQYHHQASTASSASYLFCLELVSPLVSIPMASPMGFPKPILSYCIKLESIIHIIFIKIPKLENKIIAVEDKGKRAGLGVPPSIISLQAQLEIEARPTQQWAINRAVGHISNQSCNVFGSQQFHFFSIGRGNMGNW